MINVGIIGIGVMGSGHARFSPELSSTLDIWHNLWSDNKSMAKSAREYMEIKIIAAHNAL